MLTETGLRFSVLQHAITQRFAQMVHRDVFTVEIDRDALWEMYLKSFPFGTNPIYRKRTEHDCSCCRQFIKTVGHVVSIVDGNIETVWDHLNIDAGHPYQVVAQAMSRYVAAHAIQNLFLHSESSVGAKVSRQQTEEGVLTFEHFHVALPPKCVLPSKRDEVLGDYATTHAVFYRGLSDITIDALETVLDLINQGSLYRGEEHQRTVMAFLGLKRQFVQVDPLQHRLFCWEHLKALLPSVSRIRNTVIGTLLCDLSGGVHLEDAVKSFEQKVAPTNYRRPTALVTKAMIEKAKQDLEALGLTSALERRYARAEDITVNNALFVDRGTRGHVIGDVLSSLQPTKPVDTKKFEKIEDVSIEKFIRDVLPTAQTVEAFIENRHTPNFMSLIAPVHADAKPLFKWPNQFSWSYTGDLADSIKERVKNAGGDVTGDLRCSLSWSNYDDLDVHMIEPDGHTIYYPHKGRLSPSYGVLDVDMNAGVGTSRAPVENICYADRRRMKEGVYILKVHQFSMRETQDVGFVVEIEFDGVVHTLAYPEPVGMRQLIEVARIQYTKKDGFRLVSSIPSQLATKTVWGVQTQQFRKVSMITLSPNYWDGGQVGNKHYFFVLDGCRHDGKVRGLFNEFLKPELDKHRKVMELVGSTVRTEESEHQLSGLGFSSTKRESLVCRVSGSFNRQVRIII